MKECPICLNSHPANNFFTLHDSHEVCNNCLKNLQKNYITNCPFCRETLSISVVPRRPPPQFPSYDNSDLPYQQQRAIRQINAQSLIQMGISQEVIDRISERLPFNYTSRFEAADFIISITE